MACTVDELFNAFARFRFDTDRMNHKTNGEWIKAFPVARAEFQKFCTDHGLAVEFPPDEP